MKKNKIIINLVILILVTALTIFYLVQADLFDNISSLKNISFCGYLIIIGGILVYVLCDSYIIFHSMKRINKKAKYSDGISAYLMGNLGSNVTPWKIGHFPFAAFFYNKKKYNAEETLTIVSNNHLVYSTFLSVFYFIFMIIALVKDFTVKIGSVNLQLYLISLFGAVTNIMYLILIIVLIKSKKIQSYILKIELYLVKKFKKNTDIEAYKTQKELKMKVYEKCFYDYRHRFYTYIKPMCAYFLFMVCNFGLPYLIYLLLSGNSFNITNYFYFFLLIQASKYVSNIIPIPGGTGVTEYCFIAVYEVVMGDFVSTALIIWRLLTYFGFIIIDFIFFLVFNSKNQIKEIKVEKEQLKEELVINNESD